jgi:hypothetical protein
MAAAMYLDVQGALHKTFQTTKRPELLSNPQMTIERRNRAAIWLPGLADGAVAMFAGRTVG